MNEYFLLPCGNYFSAGIRFAVFSIFFCVRYLTIDRFTRDYAASCISCWFRL